MKTALHAMVADTKKPYAETGIGTLKSEPQTWTALYQSDWAIAVESRPF